jgi:hypothetical protein
MVARFSCTSIGGCAMRISTRFSIVVLTLAVLLGVSAAASARPVKIDRGAPPAPESPSQVLTPPNDTCAGAILIPCGNIDISSTTNGATNDYTFSMGATSCTGYKADGLDVVYRIDATVGDSLWVDYRNVADGSIYLITNCNDPDNSCVAGSDQTIAPNEIESIRYRFVSTGTYYLICDSFGVNTSGDFTLAGQLLCGASNPPQNDICATATPIPCGNFNLAGTTQNATNDYTFPDDASSCTGHVAGGKDVVYKLNITAGDSLWVDYTSSTDGSIYIVADCSDVAGTCIAGVDATGIGQTEMLRHKFTYSGVYYMVLDSRGAGTSGTWSAIGSLICINPPPVNDQCAGAIAINYGPIALSGSTKLATNDYRFTNSSVSCTGYYADGRDVVYRVDATVGDSLWLDYTSSSDGSIYIVRDCSKVDSSCVIGEDVGVTGEPEHLRYTFTQSGTYYVILDSVDLDSWGTWTANGELICCTVGVESAPPPGRLAFSRVMPNPFRTSTSIGFQLPADARTTLQIYDLQGRVARTLVNGVIAAGEHRVTWNGTDDQGRRVDPGVYFARLASGPERVVRRMIFVQ